MTQTALYEIKCKVIELLSTDSPLSIEEIFGAFRSTPEQSLELALERLEKEDKITTDNNSLIHLNNY